MFKMSILKIAAASKLIYIRCLLCEFLDIIMAFYIYYIFYFFAIAVFMTLCFIFLCV